MMLAKLLVIFTILSGAQGQKGIRCRFGSMGTCGGFVGKQCPVGSTCKYRLWSTLGDCCRKTKPVKCAYGSSGDCGGFVGKQCLPGYTCQYKPFSTLGTCCKDSPKPTVCPNGADGICGGIAGLQCRPGTTCVDDGLPPFPDKAGTCCINTPAVCPNGADGICGGIAGLQCRPGTTCVDDGLPPFPDKAGTCCINTPDLSCPFGSKGQCGGKMGLQCGPGTTCILPTGIIDGLGKCCIKGVCPPSSGLPGICLFDPKRNCLGDDFCPAGQLCCSEGCGSVCKKAVLPGRY